MTPVLAANQDILTAYAIVGGVIALIFLAWIEAVFRAWLMAKLVGAPIPILTLMAMKLRKVPYQLVTNTYIIATKAGIAIGTDYMEAHYLAGGNMKAVVQALIMARNANLELDWKIACAIDLASASTGQSLIEVVKTSIKTNQSIDETFKALLANKLRS
jgi:uncharacterized protein YqfA (UPF0365 family)